MSKKILTLGILLLVICIAIAQGDNNQEGQYVTTETSSSIPTEGEITPQLWDAYQGEKTSEMFERLTEKTPDRFRQLQNSQQRIFMSSPERIELYPDISHTFYEQPENVGHNQQTDIKYFTITGNLQTNPESGNVFLNNQFNTNNVIFEIIPGIIYGNNNLCHEDNPCFESFRIKPGTSRVWYDVDSNKFCFDPTMCIEVDGTIQMQNNELILPEGSMVESTTGTFRTLEDGTIIELDENNNIIRIIGNSEGEIRTSLGQIIEYINNDGELVFSNEIMIMSEDAILSLNDVMIEGQFMIILNEGIIGSVEISGRGGFKDKNGEISVADDGLVRIIFDEEQNWKEVNAERVKLEYNNQEIYGDFKIELNDRDISQIELKTAETTYHDKTNNIKFNNIAGNGIIRFQDELNDNINSNELVITRDGSIASYGKWFIETPDSTVVALKESTKVTISSNNEEQIINVESTENGDIARIAKKVIIGDLREADGFISGETEVIYTINRQGNNNYQAIPDMYSLQEIAGLESDPRIFTLINKNLIINTPDNNFYLGITSDISQRYENDGNQINIIGPRTVHRLLGNDIDTIKEIVETTAIEESIEIQIEAINKIFELDRPRQIAISNEDRIIQFYQTAEKIREMQEFIEQLQIDDIKYDTLMASFITLNLDNIPIPFVRQQTLDATSPQWFDTDRSLSSQRHMQHINTDVITDYAIALDEYEKFIQDNFRIIEDIFDRNSMIFSENNAYSVLSELSKDLAIYQDESRKEIFENLLYARINYESSKGEERDNSAILSSYKGLFMLSSSELEYEQDEGYSVSWSSDNILDSESIIHGMNIANLYVENEDVGSAMALLEMLMRNAANNKDIPDEVIMGLYDIRRNTANNGFNTINANLFVEDQLIYERLIEPRKGAIDRIREMDSDDPLYSLGILFQGGYIKDIIDVAGGFDEVKGVATDMHQENAILTKGNYVIQQLYGQGISPQRLHELLSEDVHHENVLELTYSLYGGVRLDESNIPETIQAQITSLSDEQLRVYDFLTEGLEYAKIAYASSFNQDYQRLIGYQPNDLNYNNLASNKLTANQQFVRIETLARLAEYDFNLAQRIGSYMDEGLSPGSVAITVTTGAAFGNLPVWGSLANAKIGTIVNIAGRPISGTYIGGAIGLIEMIGVDAIAGTIMDTANLDMTSGSTVLATTLATTIGLSSTRIIRDAITSTTARTSSLALDDIATILAKNVDGSTTTARSISDIQDSITQVLRQLNPDQIDSNTITLALRNAGHNIDSIGIERALQEINFNSLARNIPDKDLTANGLRRNTDGTLETIVDGRRISSTEELHEQVIRMERNNYLTRKNNMHSEGLYSNQNIRSSYNGKANYRVSDVPDVNIIGEDAYWDWWKRQVTIETQTYVEQFRNPLIDTYFRLEEITEGVKNNLIRRGLADNSGAMLDSSGRRIVDGYGNPIKIVNARRDSSLGQIMLKEPYKIEEKVFRDLMESENLWNIGKPGSFPKGTTIDEARRMVFEALPRQDFALRDIAGTRIIVSSIDEQRTIAKLIDDNYGGRVIKTKDFLQNPRDKRYYAIHKIIVVDDYPVEIQIRTKLQTKWADWEHYTVYKGSHKKNDVVLEYTRQIAEAINNFEQGLCPHPCRLPSVPFELRGTQYDIWGDVLTAY
ncbi:MAG: hypothetical protein ACMXYG_03200 [Candidatus Woesearchaeota archaeon]